MGGYDIFYSNRLKSGGWGEAKNIGFPLNTTNDNAFFQPKCWEKPVMCLFSRTQATVSKKEIYHILILPSENPATTSKSLFNDSFSLILDRRGQHREHHN